MKELLKNFFGHERYAILFSLKKYAFLKKKIFIYFASQKGLAPSPLGVDILG